MMMMEVEDLWYTWTALVLIIATGLIASFIIFRRNKEVLSYCTRLNEETRDACYADVAAGRQWQWRYEMLKKLRDYDKMVWQFWRPLDSFYPDHSFHQLLAEGKEVEVK